MSQSSDIRIEEPFPCDICPRMIVKGDHVTTDKDGYYHTECWYLKRMNEKSGYTMTDLYSEDGGRTWRKRTFFIRG